MGWNCTIVVVHGSTLADLVGVGWTPTTQTLGWEDATSVAFDGVAAWERDDVVVLASGGLALLEAVERLGALGDTYAGTFQSVTDTYVWETAGGVGRRSWAWSQYAQVDDVGEPHPAEAGIEQLDEDALFGLLEAAGLRYDEGLEQAAFVVLTPADDAEAPPAAVPRRRKRFGIF